jgi:hypothetical protein
MTRVLELQRALLLAKDRLAYAESELQRFQASAITGPEAAKAYRKLRNDVTVARCDVEILGNELGRAMGEVEAGMPV